MAYDPNLYSEYQWDFHLWNLTAVLYAVKALKSIFMHFKDGKYKTYRGIQTNALLLFSR